MTTKNQKEIIKEWEIKDIDSEYTHNVAPEHFCNKVPEIKKNNKVKSRKETIFPQRRYI